MAHIHAQQTENHERRQAIACRRVSAGRGSLKATEATPTPYQDRINSLLSYNFFRRLAVVVALAVMVMAGNTSVAQTTVTCYPPNQNYATGYTDGTTKTSGDMHTVSNGGVQGWIKFDVSAIPNNATITSIKLYFYCNSTSNSYVKLTSAGELNPATATANALYDAIITDAPNYYTSNYISGFSSTGWKNFTLSAAAVSNLQSNGLTNDYFTIGFHEYESGSYNLYADGYNTTNRPYITVNYTVPAPLVITQSTTPDCGDDVTLTASLPGGASVPSGYAYYWYSDENCTSEITSGVSGTNRNTLVITSVNGEHVWCRLEKRTEQETMFTYNGYMQTYSVPAGAISLLLEVWGAEGGGQRTSGNTNSGYGGKGGYSVGTLPSPSGTLYVCVGGVGASQTSGLAVGGYNGGGSGYGSSNTEPGNGGGGATHIATVTGVLSSLSTQQNKVLIVAGGGGGGGEDGTDKGGDGGGLEGDPGQNTGSNQTDCSGGTQTGAGNNASFGQGASTNYGDGGGGGGGWYGGGTKQSSSTGTDTYGGGGGSGHLNPSLINATTTKGVWGEGNGKAKITAIIATVSHAGNIEMECTPSVSDCEDFESGSMPTGWTSEGDASWGVGYGDGNTSPSIGSHSGDYNARITHNTRNYETYLITPNKDFSGMSYVTLSFWYVNREWPSDIDELTVCYRVNGGAWNELFHTAAEHTDWTQQVIDLPPQARVANCQIGFKFTDHWGYGVGIDEVCFTHPAPNCTTPTITFGTPSTGTLGSSYTKPTLSCNSSGTKTWSSSNESVATVDNSGNITLVGCGTTTITVNVDADATYCAGTASYTLNVNGNTPSFTNCPSSNSTNTKSGQTWTPILNSGMSYSTAHWTSSNSARAEVNTTTGAITNKAPGEVTISATVPASGSYCGGTVSCTYIVGCAENNQTFAFNPTTGTVAEGATLPISGNITVPTGATVTYTSDNTGVATVTNAGVVTGVTAGTAHITATVSQWTNDGVTYCGRTTTNSFTVTVTGDGCVKIVNSTPTASSSGTYGGIYTWTNTIAYTQQLYTKAELNAAGVTCAGELTSIALNYQETTSSALTFDVYIGQTSLSTVPTSWITDANLALGYSGTTTFNTGWNSIDVSNAHFTWDGTSNIVVAIMRTTSTQGAVQWPNFYHTNTSNMMVYLANATLNGNHVATANGTSGVQRPEMKFCISCCTPRTGTFEYTTTSHTITAGSTYTNTTLNNQTGTSVTRYEIYPTGQGATINASSGQVTTTVGTDRTFTVTAIIEGGSTYCDLSTSYTLTVNDGCYQVGTAMSAPTSNSLLPIYTGSTSSYSYSQQVYTASDILAVDGCRGQINSIKFQYYGTSNLTIPIELYLGSTSSSSLSSGWITDAGLTKVYTSPAGGTTFSSVWVELTLDTPYDWNGTDNIVVAVKTTGTPSGTYRYFYYTSAAGTTRTCNATSEIGLSSSNNVPDVAGTAYGYRPNIRFCINCCTERDGQLNITSDPACPASIPYGSTLQLTGSVASGYGDGTASWSSSNTSVATVGESSGLISAGDIGTTVITYTRAYDGTYCKASTTCTVNVTVPTPQITQETPLPQCDIENATLVAGVPAGSAVPPGYTYHWYSNSTFTAEITSGVSGSNNNRLSYPATSGGQVWCRLEKPGSTPSQTFNYTGNVQEYTVPENATSLTLEVWGAQGGSYSSTYSGGKGGYSKGTLASPTAGSKLYVVVGQQPEAYTTTPTTGGATISGGYNGGGNAVVHYYSYSGNTGWSLPQGGGGATHIATVTGQLNTLSAQQDNVLIVAGGGSGGVYCYGTGNVGLSGYTGFSGYAGGGTTSNGYAGGTYTYTANQTAAGNGGSFGHGASYTGNTSYRYGPSGGGGGWYGGGNRQTAQDTYTEELVHGHGGGSGYIKSTLTATSSSNDQRSGNGEAKITAVIPDSYGPAKEFTIKCCGLNATIQFGD